MKITLAYPWTDDEDVEHAPDETLDVPDRKAKQLLRDGLARVADVDTDDSDPSSLTAADVFDPSTASPNRVLRYLAEADPAEQQRVLAAEAAGKGRPDVLAFTPTAQ